MTTNWQSAWGGWPKEPHVFLPMLRHATMGTRPAGAKRAVALRDPWVQLIVHTNNVAQGAATAPEDKEFFSTLKEHFVESEARASLISAILEEIDVKRMAADSPVWLAGPITLSDGKGWCTPLHPGVELAVYCRLLVELHEPAAAGDLMTALFVERLAIVASFQGMTESWAPAALKQTLDATKKFVDGGVTATFGFPAVERWAAAALDRPEMVSPRPDFADAFQTLQSQHQQSKKR